MFWNHLNYKEIFQYTNQDDLYYINKNCKSNYIIVETVQNESDAQHVLSACTKALADGRYT